MKFKIDENLPVEVCGALRAAGHDAMTVGEQRMCGTVDEELVTVCTREQRALVTLDVGIGNIVRFPPGASAGIILLRPERQDRGSVLRVLESVICDLPNRELLGKLWVADGERVRVRG